MQELRFVQSTKLNISRFCTAYIVLFQVSKVSHTQVLLLENWEKNNQPQNRRFNFCAACQYQAGWWQRSGRHFSCLQYFSAGTTTTVAKASLKNSECRFFRRRSSPLQKFLPTYSRATERQNRLAPAHLNPHLMNKYTNRAKMALVVLNILFSGRAKLSELSLNMAHQECSPAGRLNNPSKFSKVKGIMGPIGERWHRTE